MLKPTADLELASGLNRFVIHESAHQPLIAEAPGWALGPFGQWFNRNETWAEQASPWITYLARSSYLLQQGSFVADIAWFYGEDSNRTRHLRWARPLRALRLQLRLRQRRRAHQQAHRQERTPHWASSWSHDGKWIYFSSRETGDLHV
jgi:hypothetical protein